MRTVFVLLLLLALPAQAQSVAVPDGNTLEFDGKTYRLWGIDAPDLDQFCDDGWPAGQEAMRALRTLVQGRRIVCQLRAYDRVKRPLASFRADATDLGPAMVRAGMAWADRTDRDYAGQERDAIADRRGVHDHTCLLPWAWRARKR